VKGESGMKQSRRRVLLVAAIAGSMFLIPGAGASAHVQGMTPLLLCIVVPDKAGANLVVSTPEGAANGGPI
jgi:hypothetical protein